MRRALFIMLMTVVATTVASITSPVSAPAHQSGCHAAHSCPSDTGSYVCGDTGNYTFCPALSGSVSVNAYAPTVGSTVTGSFSWSAYGAATYQWFRAGAPIPGATAPGYTVTVDDLGQAITVVGSASDGRGQSASVTSTPFIPVATAKLKLSVTRVKAGRKLTFRGEASSVASVAGVTVTVRIWRKVGRSWKLKRTAEVSVDDYGEFVVSQRTPKTSSSSWRARAAFVGSAAISAARSKSVTVTTKSP